MAVSRQLKLQNFFAFWWLSTWLQRHGIFGDKFMNIGYIRVSSYDQHTDRQLEGIFIEKVFTDMVSGKDTNRPALQNCLASLRKGDTLHVHSIDRLTRNLQDLLVLLAEMVDKGITVKFHKEKLTFSSESSPFQKLHLQIIGAVAEFERAFIRERQREGIAIAKAKGKYTGRKATLSPQQVKSILQRVANRECITSLAKEYGVSRPTIYRCLQKARETPCSGETCPSEEKHKK